MSRICKVPEQKPKSKRLLICAMDTHESRSPEFRRIGISCITARSLMLIILMHDVPLIVMRTGVNERLEAGKEQRLWDEGDEWGSGARFKTNL